MLNGASANLGPESDAWVKTVEATLLGYEKKIQQLESQIAAALSR